MGAEIAAIGFKGAFVAMVLAALAVASAPTLADALCCLYLATILSYLAAFDLRTMAVPVTPILFAVALGLGVSVVEGALFERAAAALAGGAVFVALDLLHRRMRGRIGLGAGDALVAAMIGAWLGPELLAWSVALGGSLGLAWGAARQQNDAPLPFVPALAAGAAIALIWQGPSA